MNRVIERVAPLDENELAKFALLRNLKPEKLAARIPAWIRSELSKPVKKFAFKAGAAPVFPPHVRPNPIRYPSHELILCVGGPLDGTKLDMNTESNSTLEFTLAGQTGYYTRNNFERGTCNFDLKWIKTKGTIQ